MSDIGFSTERPLIESDDADNCNRLQLDDVSCGSVTSERAVLSRKIGRGCFSHFPTFGQNGTLRLQIEKDSTVKLGDVLGVKGVFGLLEIAQGTRLLRGISGIDLSTEFGADDERWDWLQSAVIGRLSDTPFSGADTLLRTPSHSSSDSVVLRLSVHSDAHVISTHARADAAVWLNIMANSRWEKEQNSDSDYLNLPLIFPARIARHTMPANILLDLGVGDVILPDTPNFTCNGEGTINVAGIEFGIRYQAPSNFEIIAEGGKMDSWDDVEQTVDEADEADNAYEEISENKLASEQRDEFANLGGLPVVLDFEIGKIKLTLGSVRTIGVGTVLQLMDGSPASIAVRSSGRLLGRGEIVDVDGQLGIRIVNWGDAS